MKAILTVKMDNAAFDGAAGAELARILRDAADKVETSDFVDAYDRNLTVRDINGNKVGEMKVTGKPVQS